MSKNYQQTGNTSSAPRPAPKPAPVQKPPPIVHQGKQPGNGGKSPWGGKK